MYFWFLILPVVAGITCRTSIIYPERTRECSHGCYIEYDKSFMFPVKSNCWNGEVNSNDEYKIFCNSHLCNADNEPPRRPIKCYESKRERCFTCFIRVTTSNKTRGCQVRSASGIVQASDDVKEVCNTPHCNVWQYEHKCYSGYFGDCTWYIDPAKIHSPQEEKCDRMHMIYQCVNQTLIHHEDNRRVCYMYGCHHKNAHISVEMLRKEGRNAKTKNNIKIDNGFANATQCNESLCNIPTPPSQLPCRGSDGHSKICPKYTTSCRMNENGDDRKCTPIGQTHLGCHGGICDCSRIACNVRKCVSKSSGTSKCSTIYCQIVWDSSTQEIEKQGCALRETNVSKCFFDENWTRYTCYCRLDKCNVLGDFKCYQSSNDQLGKLGPCLLGTKTCQTIRNSTTKMVIERSCSPASGENNEEQNLKDICYEPGCNIWGNNGTFCYDSTSMDAISCPGKTLYCQTIWNTLNWAIENQRCSSRDENSNGCRYNQDKSHLICNCVGDKCNGFGDFKCYQSLNDELGKLGPCPINTIGCRTIRDSSTKKIQSRSCLLEEFAKYPKEGDDLHEDCYETGCNLWGNNGTVCYDWNSTEAILCSSDVFYCQTIWNLWSLKVEIQGCSLPNVSSIGCYYNEDRTLYICNCLGVECNKLGDFQCYQSFNHELGKLGPCPINTTGCRTLKDNVTNEIFARGCAPNALDGPLNENVQKGQFYDPCHEPRCNNETVHGRWCPVGVKGRCFETWKNYLVPFHDLLPKPCYGFHDQCHTTKIRTSSGECAIYTCEFFDYNGNVDSTPAIEDETCYTGPQSTHCVCEGDKCLDEVRTLLDMFMNQADGLHFGISLVGLILILL